MSETHFVPRYARKKTVLRGRIHQIACYISIAWLIIYITISMIKYLKKKESSDSGGVYSTISKILILSTQIILYGCSAMYHRLNYNKWLQRIDHFCIFLFISSVHTSVLLGMLQKKRKKKTKEEKKEETKEETKDVKKDRISLPTAKDLQFKLHPNPFSINSPMRNSKGNQSALDSSFSQIESTESNGKSFIDSEKSKDLSLTHPNMMSERCLSDNSFFDCSIQKSRNYNVSDLKNQTKTLDSTFMGYNTLSSYNSEDDPTTDLSNNLSSLSSNETTGKSLFSENLAEANDISSSSTMNQTMNEKDKSHLEMEENGTIDEAIGFSDKVADGTLFHSKIESKDLNQTNWSYTQYTNQNLTHHNGESYDSSLDTTLIDSKICDISQSEQHLSENMSIKKTDTEETPEQINDFQAFYDQKNKTHSKWDEKIDISRSLVTTWLFCLFGLFKILLQTEINELLDVPIYIIHGVHIVFTCPFRKFPKTIKSSFVSGGACYILGGILFGFEFPNWKNSFFGFHEFFHVMTVMGNMCFLVPIIFNFQLIE